MSALFSVCDELVASVSAALPTVQVTDGPPAMDRDLAEAVWVDGETAEYEWRCLGGMPTNRDEQIEITLRAAAYREADTQTIARTAARARLRELIEQIEQIAVGENQTLNGSCTDARVSKVETEYGAAAEGWEAAAEITVTCQHLP